MHYANRGVEWDGFVVRVKIEEDVDPLNTMHHSATILVKMEPDDVAGQSADLGLAISMESLTRLQDTINLLHAGDHILFKASLKSVGDAQHLHHLHLFDLVKVEGHRAVDV